jgi:hypothetical protein
VARVLDPGESCAKRGLQHGGLDGGAQLQPGTETWVFIVGHVVGELDAQMPPAGES